MAAKSFREKIKSLPVVSSLMNNFRKAGKKKRMQKFYGQFIHPGDLCFDVGANVGDWSDVFLFLGAKVIGVEPQSSFFDALQKRFRENSSVEIVRVGVGSKEEERELKVSVIQGNSTFSDEFIESYKHFEYASWPTTEKVRMTTLDHLIQQFGRPKFCKIDAEGYELEILKGLSMPIRFIQFEYVPPFRKQTIESIDILSKLGEARFNYSWYEEMKLQLTENVNAEEMKWLVRSFPEEFLVGDILAEFVG